MSLIKKNILPLVIGGIGLFLVFIGFIQIAFKSSNPSPVVLEEARQDQKEEIIVDVEGAVIKPGVYKLSSDSRTVDALAAAGGLSEDADRGWVEKNINLAKKLSDGLKIYVPRVGEQVLAEVHGGTGPVLNINTASQSELESLPAVGPVSATKIIEGRPYSDISELLDKKILGSSTFEKIKDKIAAN